MGFFDNVRRVLGAKTSTSGDIAAVIAETTKAAADANAEDRAKDAAEYGAELEERLAAALADEEEATRRAQYDAALGYRDAARSRSKKDHPKLNQGLCDLQSFIADANRKIAIVNNRLPKGAAPLDDVEAFRDVPGSPREVVKEETFQQWCYVGGGVLGERAVSEVKADKEGGHFIVNDLAERVPVVQVDFRREEFLPAEPRLSAGRIANASLPRFEVDVANVRRIHGLPPERVSETKITTVRAPREERPRRKSTAVPNGGASSVSVYTGG